MQEHTINMKIDGNTAKKLREQGKHLGLNFTSYIRMLLTTSTEDKKAPAAKERKTS